MHGNEINDNGGIGVDCRSNGTLQLSGARITRKANHGVLVMLRSILILEGPQTDGSGNNWADLWRGDKESSADGLAEYFIGGTYGCTDLDD